MENRLNSPKLKKTGKPSGTGWVKVLLLILLAILIISIIILSCVPPVSKDALVHHLAIPKLYLKHGGMYEIPAMPFSYFPMNLDLLYLIPLSFGNDIAPKFIHLCFALLTAWLIFSFLKPRSNTVYALLGVIFFLSIPIIVKLSITVYVDLGLIFFSTASLLLLLKWIEDGFRLRFLLFSALFCGLAAGTKYNGLITLFLLTLFVPFLYSRYVPNSKPGFFKAAGYGILFFSVALLVLSPWMIRNYLWTSNPLYPLYDHLFNPQNGLSQQTVDLFTYRKTIYGETWWQIALLPVRVFFQGQDGNPQYFDGKLNPFLLLFPLLAFYRIKDDSQAVRNEKKMLLAYVILFFATVFFSSGMRIRYISPIIPPLVILSIFGVKKIVELVSIVEAKHTRQIGFAALFLIVSFSLCLNARYMFTQYRYVGPITYLSGRVSREQYIERYRREYPVLRYINKNLHPNAKILFIHMGKRGYYCDRDYVLDMLNNRSTLYQLVKSADKPQKVRLDLTKIGVTHLLMNCDIFGRWAGDSFTTEDQELLRSFFRNHARLLYFKSGYGVYRLENP